VAIIKVQIKKTMKSSKLIMLAAVLAFACAPMVYGKPATITETTCTQGGSTNPCNNPNGTTTTTTTSGPPGQVNNDKTGGNTTTTTTTCGPGNGANGC